MRLVDTKRESSEVYLMKYGKKNLSSGFKIMDIVRRNEVFRICSYLIRFYSDYKINSIFFKFEHFSFPMPKIKEICIFFLPKSPTQNLTIPLINRFGPTQNKKHCFILF